MCAKVELKSTVTRLLRDFFTDESGQAVAEYVVVVALVCLGMTLAADQVLNGIRTYFWMLIERMSGYTYP